MDGGESEVAETSDGLFYVDSRANKAYAKDLGVLIMSHV